jgi:hypothetical protein
VKLGRRRNGVVSAREERARFKREYRKSQAERAADEARSKEISLLLRTWRIVQSV